MERLKEMGSMVTSMVRQLGRSGIQVSAMGLGTWAIGGPAWSGRVSLGWGAVDDQQSIRAIHRALDLGVTFFDTADDYGAGHAERILGEALEGRRSQAVISTKFGRLFDEETKQLHDFCASPDYIRQACDASLKRLRTDYIDLYLFHLSWYPIDEAGSVRQVLEDLVQAGKIRAFGWSTDDPNRAQSFATGPHCCAVEFLENPLEDNPEMIRLCQRMELAGINRSPLAMGLLTGKYSSDTRIGDRDVRGDKAPAWMKYFKDGRPSQKWLKRVQAIREVLTSDGRTLSQGALGWLWARSPHLVPIPGMRTLQQVDENVGAMRFGPLLPNQMREIDRLMLKDRIYSKLSRILRRGLERIKQH